MSNASFYKWRSRFGGMDASMMTRFKELVEENRRIKKMYAEERLKAEIIQEDMAKKWCNHRIESGWRKKLSKNGASAYVLPASYLL